MRNPTAESGNGAGDRHRGALSARDLELLELLAAGRSTAQVASAMSVSTNTVRTRLRRVQVKLEVTGRDHVVNRTRQLGMI